MVIADDSPEMLDIIERQIKEISAVVVRAEDGIELIDRVRELRPDVVITDISMPRMNGLEALRQMHAEGMQVPAVIITVHEDEDLVKASLEQGAAGFVLKSKLETDLLTAVRAALDGRTFVSERLRQKIQ